MLEMRLHCKACYNRRVVILKIIDIHRSLDSSRVISSSREPSPFVHFSIQMSHSSSCSMNVQGFVQSKTIRIRVCGIDVRGGKK